MTQETQAPASEQPADYPANWLFDEHGDVVEGRYVELSEAPTRQGGLSPIVVLDVDGAHRSVWLLHEALRSSFREELERRGEPDFVSGERIVIERKGKKTSEAGREYMDYRVRFLDRPTRSATSILGVGGSRPEPEESSEESADDPDDVPF
jgi:hypothetical protein